MPKPAVLILESDQATAQQMNAVLVRTGFDVYGADRPEAVIAALRASEFPAVVVDADYPGVDASEMARAILALRPDVCLVFTASEMHPLSVANAFRAGALDFIAKPYDPVELGRSLLAGIERRRRERGEIRMLREKLKHTTTGSTATALPSAVQSFAEQGMQVFADLEREYLELARRVRTLERAQGTEAEVRILGWVAHPDLDFARGVTSLAERLRIDFAQPLQTGGEVLDHLSAGAPNVLVLADSLPDIPSEFLAQSVLSTQPRIHIVQINGWGTPERTAVLFGGDIGTPIERTLGNVNDLIALLEEAVMRSVDDVLTRMTAQSIHSRYEDFVRRYRELREQFGQPTSR
jgi:DNA-binding response OmpR family regulator